MALELRLQNHEGQAPDDHERDHNNTKHGATLLTFALFECISAMSLVSRRAIMRALLKKTSVADQNFLGIKTNEATIRIDEATNEWFCRQLDVLVGLKQVKQTDADLRR